VTGARPGDRVLVAMSGGVDSSVAAALLVAAGFDVIGVSMRLWEAPAARGCCSLDDFLDARRVASRLRIPFYVMDFRDEFVDHVVDQFVDDYLQGRTPNPCIRCNQFVKFDHLWSRARALGAGWLATGHYARVIRSAGAERAELWAAEDAAKDQSYFLFGVPIEVLNRTLFPLGGLHKQAVRAHARRTGLPVAEKPESQEVCFVAAEGYAPFVAARVPAARRRGRIVHRDGRVLGPHEGIHQFTIGQRRGLQVSDGEPLYVTAIDADSGTVTVGPRSATIGCGLVADAVTWLAGEVAAIGSRFTMKIRSRFPPVPVKVVAASATAFEVRAERGLQAVTPGQAAVLYDGGRVVAGGWIARGVFTQ
jgi:tRNA-specific 2-thiouridylase